MEGHDVLSSAPPFVEGHEVLSLLVIPGNVIARIRVQAFHCTALVQAFQHTVPR